MKKKIEGELISIAHRLLKLKTHTETVQLHEEVKKLYEQLTLLKFYEAHTALVNEEFSESVFEENVAKIVVGTIEVEEEEEEVLQELASKDHIAQIEEELFENNSISHEAFPGNGQDDVVLASKDHLERIKEELFENNTISHEAFPEKENQVAALVEATPEENVEVPVELKELKTNSDIIGTKVSKQISMDDILVHDYQATMFVKKDESIIEELIKQPVFEPVSEPVKVEEIIAETIEKIKDTPKVTLPPIGNTIALGLNDKIAFEKNLFAGNGDDLQRVLSQLNTFTNWEEAKSFVLDFVKPDYNNWQGKEEFEVRFLDLVETKFK